MTSKLGPGGAQLSGHYRGSIGAQSAFTRTQLHEKVLCHYDGRLETRGFLLSVLATVQQSALRWLVDGLGLAQSGDDSGLGYARG